MFFPHVSQNLRWSRWPEGGLLFAAVCPPQGRPGRLIRGRGVYSHAAGRSRAAFVRRPAGPAGSIWWRGSHLPTYITPHWIPPPMSARRGCRRTCRRQMLVLSGLTLNPHPICVELRKLNWASTSRGTRGFLRVLYCIQWRFTQRRYMEEKKVRRVTMTWYFLGGNLWGNVCERCGL